MSALCPHYMQENTMKNTFNTVNNCGTSAVYRAASLIREAGAGGSNPLFPTILVKSLVLQGFFHACNLVVGIVRWHSKKGGQSDRLLALAQKFTSDSVTKTHHIEASHKGRSTCQHKSELLCRPHARQSAS